MLRLLCHTESCHGHNASAGNDPEGSCRFCGERLVGDDGSLLVAPLRRFVPVSDPLSERVCSIPGVGHVWEGALEDGHADATCSRCGLRLRLAVD